MNSAYSCAAFALKYNSLPRATEDESQFRRAPIHAIRRSMAALVAISRDPVYQAEALGQAHEVMAWGRQE